MSVRRGEPVSVVVSHGLLVGIGIWFGYTDDFHVRAEPPSGDVDVSAVTGWTHIAIYDFMAIDFEPFHTHCVDVVGT